MFKMIQQPADSEEALNKQRKYLITRTIRLLNIIKKDWFERFFTIDHEGKPFNFMERLVILLKTTLLYKELLNEILLNIKRRLTFSAKRLRKNIKI